MKTFFGSKPQTLRLTKRADKWLKEKAQKCGLKGDPDKEYLEEVSYRILRQNYMEKKGQFYLHKDETVTCKMKE